MAGGRPTKYNDEILAKTEDYINNYKDHDDVIPSMASLSLILDVCVRTLYNWGDENPEFLHMLDKLQKKQEKVLLNGGLSGDMNAAITKLVLAKHSYTEKTENKTDVTSNGETLSATVNFVKSDRPT